MVLARASDRGPAAQPPDADATAAAVASLAERAQACGRRLGVDVGGAGRALAAVSPSEFGVGPGKTWAEVAAEFAGGGARLMVMEDADRRCEPVRLIDFVVIRIYAGKDDRRVLMEAAQRRDGGQGGAEAVRLPEARAEWKGDRAEARGEVVARLQRELLGGVAVSFCAGAGETQLHEADSDVHPGIKTLHRKEIVEGHVTATDPEQTSTVGLQAGGTLTFTVRSEGEGTTSEYAWLSEEQLLERGAVAGFARPSPAALPTLVPMDLGLTARPDEGQFCKRVKDAYSSVNAIFEQHEQLSRLEGLVAAVEDPWLSVNGAGVPAPEEQLRHLAARRAHVARHGEQLRGFAGALAEIEQSQSSINYPELQEAPSNNLRLQRLEAKGALLARAAAKLHEDVSTVAEEYHSAMTGLSEQFLAWNSALDQRIAAKR